MDPKPRAVITSSAAEKDLVTIRAHHDELVRSMNEQAQRVANFNAQKAEKQQNEQLRQDKLRNEQQALSLKQKELQVKQSSSLTPKV